MPESAGKLLAALVLQFRIEGNRTRPGDACRDSEAGQSRPRTPALLVAISMHLAADGEPAAVTARLRTPHLRQLQGPRIQPRKISKACLESKSRRDLSCAERAP